MATKGNGGEGNDDEGEIGHDSRDWDGKEFFEL